MLSPVLKEQCMLLSDLLSILYSWFHSKYVFYCCICHMLILISTKGLITVFVMYCIVLSKGLMGENITKGNTKWLYKDYNTGTCVSCIRYTIPLCIVLQIRFSVFFFLCRICCLIVQFPTIYILDMLFFIACIRNTTILYSAI